MDYAMRLEIPRSVPGNMRKVMVYNAKSSMSLASRNIVVMTMMMTMRSRGRRKMY